MKKTLLILFVAVASLTACKKDKEGKLEGRWDLVKQYNVQTLNGTKINEETETFKTGELYVVFSGNTYKTYEDGDLEDEGTFTANENSITLKDGDGDSDTMQLRWNSKSEFVMTSEDSYSDNGQTYLYKNETTLRKN